jgi:uncharacterized membrane protein
MLVLVASGIFFRFATLDAKPYWYDEAFTSLELSGLSPSDAEKDILTGRQIGMADLNRYQTPRSGKTLSDTVRGIARIEPQLTPLYFIVARFWAEWFGNSVWAIRSLSVLFSLSILPLAGWLCLELFGDWRVCWCCVALMSVSPFQVLYAQEARPYSMWAALSLGSSILLLRVLRKESRLGWVLYGASLVLGLYTYLFTVLVIAGHAVYVAIATRFRIRSLVSFLATSGIAVALLLPWPYRGQASGSGNEAYSLVRYATKWVRNVSVFFVDFNFSDATPKTYLLPFTVCLIILVLLAAYAIYFVAAKAPLKASAFVLTLIFTLSLAICALDLVSHSSRATVTRYLYPSLIGVQIAVAYLLAQKTGATTRRGLPLALWKGVAGSVLGLGVISCCVIAASNVWWSKAPDNFIPFATQVINHDKAPLVVSDAWFLEVLCLEHSLRADTRFQLTVSPQVPTIKDEDRTFYVYRPSAHLLSALGQRYDVELVDSASGLWRARTRQL